MTAFARALAALAGLVITCEVESAQNVFGTSKATVCYESATDNPDPQGISTCTNAIKDEDLTRSDLSATYSNRGILWASKGRLDRALDDQNTSIRLNATSARAYINRANVYFRMKDYPSAIVDYGRAEDLSSGQFATVFYNRSLAHLAVGDANAARADLQRAASLAPENPAYREALTNLQ